MFEGGGFGVGVTVTPLDVEPWPVELLPAGVMARPSRLGELMPVAARSDAEIAAELQRIEQLEGRLAAYKVELVAGLAARRPDSADRRIGEPGAASPDWLPGVGRQAAGVSEFFADELAQILNCSRTAATVLADAALLLTERLPGTWAALADGLLDWPRATALAAELLEPARDVEPHVLAEVEGAVLPRAAGLSVQAIRRPRARNCCAVTPPPRIGAARRRSGPPTSWSIRCGTGWPSCGRSCRSRWRPRSGTASTPTPGWPRPTVTRGRSASCVPGCWVIWCCARGTRRDRRSPPGSPCGLRWTRSRRRRPGTTPARSPTPCPPPPTPPMPAPGPPAGGVSRPR